SACTALSALPLPSRLPRADNAGPAIGRQTAGGRLLSELANLPFQQREADELLEYERPADDRADGEQKHDRLHERVGMCNETEKREVAAFDDEIWFQGGTLTTLKFLPWSVT